MTLHDESTQEPEQLPRETWASLPSLSPFSGPTVPTVGCRFFIHSSTILKLGTEDGEGTMTALAHSILGPCVPRVVCLVTLPIITSDASTPNRAQEGLVLTLQPGKPLVELWPSLTPPQRQTVKAELCRLLVRLRTHHFSYYGRPTRKPYLLFSVHRDARMLRLPLRVGQFARPRAAGLRPGRGTCSHPRASTA
jgi:hypothetical protein